MAPWNVLAGGKIRTDEEEEARRESGERGRQMYGPAWERTEDHKKVCKALEKVAKDVGAKCIQAGTSQHNPTCDKVLTQSYLQLQSHT